MNWRGKSNQKRRNPNWRHKDPLTKPFLDIPILSCLISIWIHVWYDLCMILRQSFLFFGLINRLLVWSQIVPSFGLKRNLILGEAPWKGMFWLGYRNPGILLNGLTGVSHLHFGPYVMESNLPFIMETLRLWFTLSFQGMVELACTFVMGGALRDLSLEQDSIVLLDFGSCFAIVVSSFGDSVWS